MVLDTFKEAIATPPSYSLTAAELQKIPYAVIYGQLDDGPQAVIVLGYIHGAERQWLTAQGESLTTKHGRLVRSAGLAKNLASLNFDGIDPLTLPLAQLDGATAHGTVDIMPTYQFGEQFTSTFSVRDERSVMLGPKQKTLTLVEERFDIPALEYHAVNRFWMDKKGLVWKSEQAPAPSLPTFRITLLKAFSGDLK